jgi:hypothetical protein
MFGQHIGREAEISVNKRTYKLSRLTRAIWRKWFEWARTMLPDPLKVAHAQVTELAREEWRLSKDAQAAQADAIVKDGQPADPAKAEEAALLWHLVQTNRDEQKFLTRIAIDKAASYLSMDAPETQSLLGAVEGQVELLYLLMKPNHPEITPDDALEIHFAIGEEAMASKLAQAGGTLPPGYGGGKEPAPAASN